YNSILKLDPHNRVALDELSAKYEALGRWNDLISVLSRRAELSDLPAAERAEILRRIAGLWSERFGNYAQAIKPLERLLELVPDDDQAIAQLKEIYTRRRQWRSLVELLGREAEKLDGPDKRDKLAEMAKLATERLGDNSRAIELWNRVLPLGEANGEPGYDREALTALAHLNEREKRYADLAEIYRRQRVLAEGDKEAITVLERLGALYSDRLSQPDRAAEALREILTIDPQHSRALRTLRDLYATTGDYRALEELYGQLGQWNELIDALQAMADRMDDGPDKVALLERAAAIAAEHAGKPDKVARAYERVLSADPHNLDAARALVPIYEQTHKWARLLSTYEILLEHAEDDATRLQLHLSIRDLCESRLGSKALAFQWMAKAFTIAPDDPALLTELERLGQEADEWPQVAEILDRRVAADDIAAEQKLVLLRELGKIAASRLHQPERARGYQRQVLELSPDDPEAMAALEEIASNMSDWPALLEVYRRRVELSESDDDKVELLFKIAFNEEERLADLDAAAQTYRRILDISPDSQRAMRALAKLQEARGDWDGLAEVLGRELIHTADEGAKVELLLRIGTLRESSLDRAEAALDAYSEALDLAPDDDRVHAALERFMGPLSIDWDEGEGDGGAAGGGDDGEADEAAAGPAARVPAEGRGVVAPRRFAMEEGGGAAARRA
ncbi:MAG: tetratricopeptide repeat protein, partial [Myxococcota bacterium]